MFENKLLIDLYVLTLDKNYECFVPINDKVGNIVNLFGRSFFEINSNKSYVLLNLSSGKVYNYNDLIRDTDIQNGSKLMLI